MCADGSRDWKSTLGRRQGGSLRRKWCFPSWRELLGGHRSTVSQQLLVIAYSFISPRLKFPTNSSPQHLAAQKGWRWQSFQTPASWGVCSFSFSSSCPSWILVGQEAIRLVPQNPFRLEGVGRPRLGDKLEEGLSWVKKELRIIFLGGTLFQWCPAFFSQL